MRADHFTRNVNKRFSILRYHYTTPVRSLVLWKVFVYFFMRVCVFFYVLIFFRLNLILTSAPHLPSPCPTTCILNPILTPSIHLPRAPPFPYPPPHLSPNPPPALQPTHPLFLPLPNPHSPLLTHPTPFPLLTHPTYSSPSPPLHPPLRTPPRLNR